MTLALYRIDDRLIHGQVVVGWGQPLDCSFIVLVDDEVSSSDWEQTSTAWASRHKSR
jgi:PTS system mannose-specific IIB component/fructoselysine and glucoselysine-specific PTS system IIB component